MPSSTEILAGLRQIANEAFAFGVGWHIVVGTVLIALSFRWWRPSPRLMGELAGLPFASVSAFAWAFDNPFNGVLFALVAVALALAARRAPLAEGRRHRTWAAVLGWLLIAFAWSYPHFLVVRAPLAYLYGAPMGLIPCPTLALVIGFALMGYGPSGRAWSGILASAGLFYALFGVLRLGVMIDLILLVGALGLTVETLCGMVPALRTCPCSH
jgi:hypothetical protein